MHLFNPAIAPQNRIRDRPGRTIPQLPHIARQGLHSPRPPHHLGEHQGGGGYVCNMQIDGYYFSCLVLVVRASVEGRRFPCFFIENFRLTYSESRNAAVYVNGAVCAVMWSIGHPLFIYRYPQYQRVVRCLYNVSESTFPRGNMLSEFDIFFATVVCWHQICRYQLPKFVDIDDPNLLISATNLLISNTQICWYQVPKFVDILVDIKYPNCWYQQYTAGAVDGCEREEQFWGDGGEGGWHCSAGV